VTVSSTLHGIQFPAKDAKVTDGGVAFSTSASSNGFDIAVEWDLTPPAPALAGTIRELWTVPGDGLAGKADLVISITTGTRTP
jgi:hypothetical protein